MVDPLGWPLSPHIPDPLEHAVGEVMHQATINLWRDLWQRVEQAEQREQELDQEIAALIKTATRKLRQQNGQLRGLITRLRRSQ